MSDHKLAEQSRLIAACQRVMYLIDTYVARPNGGNRHSIREALLELAAHEHQDIAALVEGMSVSVDVSTDDATEERRYFGTVTEAMEHPDGKHGLMLLVQDAEPNWDKEAEQQAGEAVAWVDERAIAWLDGRSRTATITTTLQAGKSLERPMPLFTRPQQPLTEIRRLAIIMQARSIREAIEMTEDAHGITKDTK